METVRVEISGSPEVAKELGHRIYELLRNGKIFPRGDPGASASLAVQGDLLKSYDGIDDPAVNVEIIVE